MFKMEKKELSSILSELLVPIGFKKKGDHWVKNDGKISKMVYLQKSQFSNSFYINYGYILKAIPLNGLKMHLFEGLGYTDEVKQQRVAALLNLDNSILEDDRKGELKEIFLENLVPDIQEVNTEEDVLDKIKKRPHTNDIPLIVKEYFNL